MGWLGTALATIVTGLVAWFYTQRQSERKDDDAARVPALQAALRAERHKGSPARRAQLRKRLHDERNKARVRVDLPS